MENPHETSNAGRRLAVLFLAAGGVAVVLFFAVQAGQRTKQTAANQHATFEEHVTPAANAEVVHISIEGMTCAGCAESVANEVKKVAGVKECRVDLARKEAVVKLERADVSRDAIVAAVEDAGYTASVEK